MIAKGFFQNKKVRVKRLFRKGDKAQFDPGKVRYHVRVKIAKLFLYGTSKSFDPPAKNLKVKGGHEHKVFFTFEKFPRMFF